MQGVGIVRGSHETGSHRRADFAAGHTQRLAGTHQRIPQESGVRTLLGRRTDFLVIEYAVYRHEICRRLRREEANQRRPRALKVIDARDGEIFVIRAPDTAGRTVVQE